MVQITSFVGAVALLSSFAAGLPRPQEDSAIGIEVAVSAPEGIPLTDTVELASQLAREAGIATAPAPVMVGSYGAVKQPDVVLLPPPVLTSVPIHAPTPIHAPPVLIDTPVHLPPVHTPVHIPPPVVHTPVHVPPVVHKPVHLPPVVHTPVHLPPVLLPTHGSGKKDWGVHDQYNDCVQQCIATYGSGPGQHRPTPTAGSPVVIGTGVTHTVIVAPSQGVFRYIPFAVNASVGETVEFRWWADNHTVTKSSQLLPCNRTEEGAFASGPQVKDFIFSQVVTDTRPTYFHCAVGRHCQSGMFGIINPATNFVSPSAFNQQVTAIGQNSSNVQGYAAFTAEQTASNQLAARWGAALDMAEIPDWAKAPFAENVLYTRNFLAANPEVLKEDGSIDLSTASTVPFSIPEDIARVLNNSGSGSGSPSSPSSSETAAAEAPAQSSAAPGTGVPSSLRDSGASSLASSKMFVAAVAIFATTLLL